VSIARNSTNMGVPLSASIFGKSEESLLYIPRDCLYIILYQDNSFIKLVHPVEQSDQGSV